MDKSYAQRLHKYELVLRGFFLTALRLQLKPYKDYFKSHGYLGQPSDLIRPQALKTAYSNAYQYISDAELYPEWKRLDKDYKSTQKSFDLDDGFLVVSETLRNFFSIAAINYYNAYSDELNNTSIDMLETFIKNARAKGYSDSQIVDAMTAYENDLRTRSGVMSATESETIMQMVKNMTASKFFTQNGVTGYKTWFTRRDEAVRHTHTEVEGRTVPMETKFLLNMQRGGVEFADFPGDPELSAGNRVHCRCLVEYHSDPNKYKTKGD